MIDLREKDRVRIIALAQKTLPPDTKVWAYGSRVKGTNYEASDLNLVLVSEDQPVTQDRLQAFKHALQDSTIPIIVQVLIWEAIPASFQENILKCYEVLCVIKPIENDDGATNE